MNSKHYREQKMLIENFRKWQQEELELDKTLNENEENIEEEQKEYGFEFADSTFSVLDFLPAEIKAFILAIKAVFSILKYMTFGSAMIYTMAPYLKIAMHHPKVYEALTGPPVGEEDKTSVALRVFAMGLRSADNTAVFVQDFVDKMTAAADKEGRKIGIMDRLSGSFGVFVFLVLLYAMNFPILGAAAVRALPRVILMIKSTKQKAKKEKANIEARIKGLPSPEEQEKAQQIVEKELAELEQLEKQEAIAREKIKPVAEVMKLIKDDPVAMAEKLGVELTEEDLKALKVADKQKQKRKSKAKKVEIPPRKDKDSDEQPDDKKASSFAGFSSFNKKK